MDPRRGVVCRHRLPPEARGSRPGGPSASCDGAGAAVPSEVAEQDERYAINAPLEAAGLAEKRGGLGGSVSFWFQPQWQKGNQDDATLVEIADGQLRPVKNVNFLRLEFTDNE